MFFPVNATTELEPVIKFEGSFRKRLVDDNEKVTELEMDILVHFRFISNSWDSDVIEFIIENYFKRLHETQSNNLAQKLVFLAGVELK